MGLMDYFFPKTEVKTRFYQVSNGNGTIHNYLLGNMIRGKELIDRYWQPVDSEGRLIFGTTPDRKLQCISPESYRDLVQQSRDVKTVSVVQIDLERLAQKTTPQFDGEGILVRITCKDNLWQMAKIGRARPLS